MGKKGLKGLPVMIPENSLKFAKMTRGHNGTLKTNMHKAKTVSY